MTEDLRIDTGAGSDAIAQVRRIAAAAELSDGRPPVSDQALIAIAQGGRELLLFSPAADATAAPVAFGVVGEGELDLVVEPRSRGRGIGTAALEALLARAAGAVADSPAGTAPLLAWSHGENPAADALLARAGFAPARSLYLMSLDSSLLPDADRGPAAVPLPDGFALRSYGAGGDPAADAREWVRVNAAAFATHPEQGRITEADFALMRDEPWFDPADLLLLAAPADPAVPAAPARLAGYTWVKTVPGETADAAPAVELYAIGVDPAYSGTGLGRALLDVTLARMAQHRPASVELYVDGENERAVGMYERAAFTIASCSRQWALQTPQQ